MFLVRYGKKDFIIAYKTQKNFNNITLVVHLCFTISVLYQ